MTLIEAMILGIIQGITEFLPISSSGHLVLFQNLFGLKNLDQYILFDLVVHVATLLAILIYFFKPFRIIFLHDWRRLVQVGVGTLPLFPLLLILSPIKSIFDQPEVLGYCFLWTAFLLFLGVRFGKAEENTKEDSRSFLDGLVIGVFQAIAILPGVSRSGSTISTARILGWKRYDAVLFSFLLAVPAMLGGTCLELLKLITNPLADNGLTLSHYAIGFVSSFFVGLYSLHLVVQLAMKDAFRYFVWYCLALGLGCILYYNIIQ